MRPRMKRIAVLGAGLVGSLMARELAADGRFEVTAFDRDDDALDPLAKSAGVPTIVDCGVSPGLSNLAAGRAESLLDGTDAIRIYVGGLPFRRVRPYKYWIVFSATDVIEEYTREARIRENGRTVVKPALSEPEEIDFPEVGTLEAVNTDGLRTLVVTSKAPNVREKTLRYPGHATLMRALRETGFFSADPVEAGGVRLAPRADLWHGMVAGLSARGVTLTESPSGGP